MLVIEQEEIYRPAMAARQLVIDRKMRRIRRIELAGVQPKVIAGFQLRLPVIPGATLNPVNHVLAEGALNADLASPAVWK